MNRLLVTGTDTGVGKTLVASAVAAALARQMRVAPFKPVETGCTPSGAELRPDDAIRLSEASGTSIDLDLVCPYRFAEPLAPWIAAERAGRPISIPRLHDCFRDLSARADFVLAESAGGLLVPLTERYSFADLAQDLELPILLVVASRLGAINHTLLTLECAAKRGLRTVGYVLNQVTPCADLATETNAAVLERLAPARRLASIPYLKPGRADLQEIGDLIAAHVLQESGASAARSAS